MSGTGRTEGRTDPEGAKGAWRHPCGGARDCTRRESGSRRRFPEYRSWRSRVLPA